MSIKTAAAAIDRSISHSEIVNVNEGTDGIVDDLHEACFDCAKNGDVFEFWGAPSAPDGGDQAWRVHVLMQSSDDYVSEDEG